MCKTKIEMSSVLVASEIPNRLVSKKSYKIIGVDFFDFSSPLVFELIDWIVETRGPSIGKDEKVRPAFFDRGYGTQLQSPWRASPPIPVEMYTKV